jgi:hypothetical protein
MLLALRSLYEPAGGDVIVNLTGVAASPAIGTGEVRIQRRNLGFGEPRREYTRPRKKPEIVLEPEFVFGIGMRATVRVGQPRFKIVNRVTQRGVSGSANLGSGGIATATTIQMPIRPAFTVVPRINVTISGESVWQPMIQVGNGMVVQQIGLSDEEILALLAA